MKKSKPAVKRRPARQPIKNCRLIEAREAEGLDLYWAAAAIGISAGVLQQYEHGLYSPVANGRVRVSALSICRNYEKDIEYFWPDVAEEVQQYSSEHMGEDLLYLSLRGYYSINEIDPQTPEYNVDPEYVVARKAFLKQFLPALATLTPAEEFVLRHRYIEDQLTLEEISQLLGKTRERVRQLECKALHKLRHRHRQWNLIGHFIGVEDPNDTDWDSYRREWKKQWIAHVHRFDKELRKEEKQLVEEAEKDRELRRLQLTRVSIKPYWKELGYQRVLSEILSGKFVRREGLVHEQAQK